MTVSALKYKIAYLLLIIFASHGNEIYKKNRISIQFHKYKLSLRSKTWKQDLRWLVFFTL